MRIAVYAVELSSRKDRTFASTARREQGRITRHRRRKPKVFLRIGFSRFWSVGSLFTVYSLRGGEHEQAERSFDHACNAGIRHIDVFYSKYGGVIL